MSGMVAARMLELVVAVSLGAAIALIAVAMGGAIRFHGPVRTRPTPASPTAPYSAVVDPDHGRRATPAETGTVGRQ